jgi:hypothetical protein
MVQITSQTDETGTTVSVRQRPSVLGVFAGLLVFLVGAAMLYVDARIAIANKQAPHLGHLFLYAGLCLVGVVIAFAVYVIPPLRSFSVIIAPYVPMLGGRRAGDAPTPTPTAPPPPTPPGPPTGPAI